MLIDLGILYGIVAFCCSVVNIIIQNRSNKAIFNQKIQKPFSRLLIFFIIFSLVDGCWGGLVSPLYFKNLFLLKLFTYLFHTGAALAAFMWVGYIFDYLKVKDNIKKNFNLIRYIIFTLQLCLLFQNLFTKNLFNISNDYVYLPTPYRNFTFYVQFMYFLIVLIYSLLEMIKSNLKKIKIDNNSMKNAFFFSITPLLFGFGQMYFPDAPFYSIGFMFTSVLIYGYNISVEHEIYIHELHKKENDELSNIVQTLSSNYEAIYYVDLQTNRYKNYVKNTPYDKKIDSVIKFSDNFFDVLPENIEKVVYEPDRKNVIENTKKETILKNLKKDDVFSLNYRLMIDGEPIYHQLKCIKSEKDEEKLIVGVFNIHQQMEEQTKRNESLRIAKEKAESANKAKSAFLFNMSHDIRTPMNAIQGYTELVEKNIDDKEKVINYLSKIKQSNEHLIKLLNNVLDMSRIENSTVTISEVPFDVVEGFNKILSMIQIEAEQKNIQVSNQFVDIQNRYLLVDVLHLNQILINVLNNAIKYTKEGGSVALIVQQMANSKKEMVPVKISISDTGIGMSKEFVKHIFEEFKREKNTTQGKVEGTGLGMSIVKRLVDLMDGEIDIQSEEGVGTNVDLTLYFKTCSEGAFKESINKQTKFLFEQINLSEKRVLVVDDVEFNREIVTEVLQDENMIVETAADGIVALQKVRDNPANYYDIILMDVQMPEMDGYETTRRIRDLGADFEKIPIIAMTANAFEEDKQNAIKSGMNAHMAKPIKIDDLKNILNVFLN